MEDSDMDNSKVLHQVMIFTTNTIYFCYSSILFLAKLNGANNGTLRVGG
jgi:hypothetical protein